MLAAQFAADVSRVERLYSHVGQLKGSIAACAVLASPRIELLTPRLPFVSSLPTSPCPCTLPFPSFSFGKCHHF